MSKRLVVIGMDEPALNATQSYLKEYPDAEVTVLYPELNPLPEFICGTVERYLQNGMTFPEDLRASGIDRDSKQVLTRDVASGAESAITYDALIIATGSAPEDLNIPGDHIGGIVRVGSFDDAKRLRAIEGKTVIVGGGSSLLLTISSLMRHKTGTVEVIIPANSEYDAPLSDNLMGMVHHHLTTKGIVLHKNQKLVDISQCENGIKIRTTEKEIVADRIVNATPSQPITHIFSSAGLSMSRNGGIVVDSRLRTNDPHIYACGSCATFTSPFCDIPVPGITIRASEPRQSCTLAANLIGNPRQFTTPTGAYSIILDKFTVAGAGLTLDEAKKCGFTPMSATVVQFDRAHFMHGVELMTLELVFDAPTRRVLGIQGLAKSGQALCGRISAVSAILSRKPKIEDISNLEIAYSPPFASAMDVLNTAANVADNMLEGINEGIDAIEFKELWKERECGEHFFIDCRELGNARPFVEKHPTHWNHIPQGQIARRLSEIPEDKKIILICNTGARSYEAQVVLKHAGFKSVVNVDGGMAAVRQSGIEI